MNPPRVLHFSAIHYSGGGFVGAVCYADDIVLLAPCALALRVLLDICDTFASSHGLVFNAAKTQLICFRQRYTNTFPPEIIFNGSRANASLNGSESGVRCRELRFLRRSPEQHESLCTARRHIE